jgi:hypothetical protein
LYSDGLSETRELLGLTADLAASFLEPFEERPVLREVDVDALRSRTDGGGCRGGRGRMAARATVRRASGSSQARSATRPSTARCVCSGWAPRRRSRPTNSFESDGRTHEILRRVQASGEAWMSGTTWDGRAAIRVSVSNWQTTDDDVERTLRAYREAVSVSPVA